MRTVLLLVASLAALCGAEPWKYLWLNVQHHYEIPTNLEAIKTGQEKYGKYEKMAHDDELNVDLYSFKDDPRVSLLIDTHGNIGGVRVSFIQNLAGKKGLLKNLTLPPGVYGKPLFTEDTYWNLKVWHSDMLFVDPDQLKAGGREGTPELVADDIYLKPNGKWFKVPKDECDILDKGWIQQTCMPSMGMHYLFNTTADQTCEEIQGIAVMYDYGYLSSVNIIPFGFPTDAEGGRVWYDDALPGDKAKRVYPNTPECLKDWTDDFGVSSVHIFLNTKHPSTVVCDEKSQDPNRCKKA